MSFSRGLGGVRSVFLLVLIGLQHSAAAQAPEVLLERMQEAVENLNYQGTLLHMTPGHMEQFRVYHRVAEEGTTERLVLVDGAGAEIIRTPDEVICIFPEQGSVVIESKATAHAGRGPLRKGIPAIADIAPDYYRLEKNKPGKVAERESVQLSILPQDEFRYGYRIWLDRETAMPLKSQLVATGEAMPLEEIRFVSISLPAEVSAEAVKPGIDTSSYTVSRHGEAHATSTLPDGDVNWSAEALPPGFMLSTSRYEYMEGAEKPRGHLVYTDGLASVSVFLDEADDEQAEGFSSMGAANAYSVTIDDAFVTAIGEVPPVTVQQIAGAMRKRP